MRYIVAILTVIVLNAHFAYGDEYGFYAPNETITCDAIPTNMNAVYTVGRHTCQPGYYLPADADNCAVCPNGGYCSGGTFTFDPNDFQGLVLTNMSTTASNVCADNFPSTMYAKYTINQHTCAAGYYLPANTDGCVICPADSYCAGGTYTFDETLAQGVQSCAAGLYSPAGMSNANQCGHILHIGNDIVYLHQTKKTTPSLHAKVGDTVFYGNMTTADVPMHAGSERKLKVQYNNTTYSVYDDTVQINE